MKGRHILLLACLCVVGALGSCTHQETTSTTPSTDTKGQDKVDAVVSILPQAYFVECVGGDRVSVEVLVGSGQSPATYEPTPSQMVALDRADVYFRIGVPFENTLIEKITASLPDLNVVDTREGIRLRPIEGEDAREGHEGEGGEHQHHGALDPHIWLDPNLVSIQARTIRDELVRLDPEGAQLCHSNLEGFQADLERVNSKIAQTLAPLKGSDILVFHPAYGYFADAYGLKQVAIETEGKEPGAKHLAEIIDRAKSRGVKVIFVQPEFAPDSAEAIAKEIGGAVVPMDPLAHDYIANLEEMADKVKASLQGGSH